MIGWAVVSGTVDWRAGLLVRVIFLWTPPHFWALALVRSADCAAAGSRCCRSSQARRRQILAYSFVLAPLSGSSGWRACSIDWSRSRAMELLRRAWFPVAVAGNTGPAKVLFRFSIFYLFAIFAALLIEAVVTRVLSAR